MRLALQADLRTASAVEKLFADAVAEAGRPDIAINTVGELLKKPRLEIAETEYDELAAVNTKSACFFLKEAGRHVDDNGKVISLVTSLLGAYTPFYAAYVGTKALVEHFTARGLGGADGRDRAVSAGAIVRNICGPSSNGSRP